MARYKHIVVQQSGTPSQYTSTSGGGSQREYRYPVRNPAAHAAKLRSDVEAAKNQVSAREHGLQINDLVLEFVGPEGAGIESDKLDDRRAGMELLCTREESGVTYATVFVPEAAIPAFLRKVQDYESKQTRRNKPKNKALMESLEGVRLPVVKSFWTDDPARFPGDPNQPIWWEVWLRRSAIASSDGGSIPDSFKATAQLAGLRITSGTSVFAERIVFLVHGSAAQWASSFSLLMPLAELRRATELPTDYAELRPNDQRALIQWELDRIRPPPSDAPAVCLVDTGCHHLHPLLQPVVNEADCHVWDRTWSIADQAGHGTEMAGIAIYGAELANILTRSGPIELTHRLESVKFLNDFAPHDPENFGNVTVESVAIAELANPARKRVVCMMTTADAHDSGAPLLWSSQLDQHASGELDEVRRLYAVSVGNVRNYLADPFAYPESNRTAYNVEDPAQAYNVLTVGGYTERVTLSAANSGRECIAPAGGLSPLSRTSMMWDADDWSPWPFKPDIVMEAGNYLRDAEGRPEAAHDLHLLTTRVAPTGQLLTTTGDTSAATAQAAKLAAEIMADYPALWPETVRGLIVHSAEWTPQMISEFPEANRDTTRKRLRCYGYGVPSAERARVTLNNCVSLIVQDSLQPFMKDGSDIKTNEYKLHALPWPTAVLEQLSAVDVTVKITLSYFIEPSPGRRGFSSKFRYASHGLRFAVRGATESDEEFRRRISREDWSDAQRLPAQTRTEDRPATGEPQAWTIGTRVRTRGSIHCDWWTASAADIARCGAIAVYPVTGWWKERPGLKRYTKQARYALIVTLSTPDQSVDLYTPIVNKIATTVPI